MFQSIYKSQYSSKRFTRKNTVLSIDNGSTPKALVFSKNKTNLHLQSSNEIPTLNFEIIGNPEQIKTKISADIFSNGNKFQYKDMANSRTKRKYLRFERKSKKRKSLNNTDQKINSKLILSHNSQNLNIQEDDDKLEFNISNLKNKKSVKSKIKENSSIFTTKVYYNNACRTSIFFDQAKKEFDSKIETPNFDNNFTFSKIKDFGKNTILNISNKNKKTIKSKDLDKKLQSLNASNSNLNKNHQKKIDSQNLQINKQFTFSKNTFNSKIYSNKNIKTSHKESTNIKEKKDLFICPPKEKKNTQDNLFDNFDKSSNSKIFDDLCLLSSGSLKNFNISNSDNKEQLKSKVKIKDQIANKKNCLFQRFKMNKKNIYKDKAKSRLHSKLLSIQNSKQKFRKKNKSRKIFWNENPSIFKSRLFRKLKDGDDKKN